jgi:uncharacterized protein (TIGR02001 family)
LRGYFRHQTGFLAVIVDRRFDRVSWRKQEQEGLYMRRNKIKSTLGSAAVVAMLATGSALAADMPVKALPPPPAASLFKIEFSAALTTDYIFRGTTQSNRGPSANAYATAVWADTFYLGLGVASISWPDRAGYLLSDPTAEVDFYGGARFGAGNWSFDVGGIYYYYPGERFFDSEFWEVYGTAEYAVNDQFSWSAGIWYSPDYLQYGIDGTTGTLGFSWTTPTPVQNVDFFFSGEVGRVWLGDTSDAGVSVPNYNFWNLGLGWNWKSATLDLRYHDTNLSSGGCMAVWNGGGTRVGRWCGPAYVATLSFAFETE